MPAAPAPAGRGKLWQALLGIAISAAFLYWALKDQSPAAVLEQVRRADPLLFLLSVVIVTLTFPARAVRWRILLEQSGGTRLPFRPVWLATAIGFMSNNILPARAGEVARAYAGAQLVGQPVSTALSTIAIERIFDGVVLVFLLFVGIAAAGFPADVLLPGGVRLTSVATTFGAIFAGALVFLALVARWPDASLGMVDGITAKLLPAKVAAWCSRVSRHLFSGLAVLRSPRAFASVLFWSFMVWGLNALSFVVAFRAFHMTDLPATAALVLQGITAIGVAVPSSPGYVGVFEAAVIASLGIYGIPKEAAVGFALALHAAWFVPITVLGLWALLRAGLKFGELRASGTTPAGA